MNEFRLLTSPYSLRYISGMVSKKGGFITPCGHSIRGEKRRPLSLPCIRKNFNIHIMSGIISKRSILQPRCRFRSLPDSQSSLSSPSHDRRGGSRHHPVRRWIQFRGSPGFRSYQRWFLPPWMGLYGGGIAPGRLNR